MHPDVELSVIRDALLPAWTDCASCRPFISLLRRPSKSVVSSHTSCRRTRMITSSSSLFAELRVQYIGAMLCWCFWFILLCLAALTSFSHRGNSFRRLDLIFVPPSEWATSLLYFTGSDYFNRSFDHGWICAGRLLISWTWQNAAAGKQSRYEPLPARPLRVCTKSQVFELAHFMTVRLGCAFA